MAYEIVSYEKAKLEYFDRQVEYSFDSLAELEQTVADSEFFQDALHQENIGGRCYFVEGFSY